MHRAGPAKLETTMSDVTDAKMQYGIWGFVAGAGAAMIIGFNWGGWTTSSTTQRLNESAVLASRASICAAQFMGSRDAKAHMKEYQLAENYKRSELIEKGGWDRMPGEEKATWGVSSACVAQLDALIKPGA
jgi:hypothetical protein